MSINYFYFLMITLYVIEITKERLYFIVPHTADVIIIVVVVSMGKQR